MHSYTPRTSKLKSLQYVMTAMEQSPCVPVIIAVCGAFNPIHKTHITLYESAQTALTLPSVCDRLTGLPYLVLGGYLSPVGDSYGKPGLLKFSKRVEIAEAAVRDHPAIEVDCWEGLQPTYTRTYFVLKHLQEVVQAWYDAQADELGHGFTSKGVVVRVAFACGTDLFQSFFKPGCWRLDLLQKLIDSFQVVVISRPAGLFAPLNEHRDSSLSSCLTTLDDQTVGESDIATGGVVQLMPKITVMTQVIDGEIYTLDFSKYRFIYQQPTFPSTASSTAIRLALVEAAEAARREDVAGEEVARCKIKDMVPKACYDLVLKYYLAS